MTKDRITVVLNIAKKHFSADIEVPLNITVNEFIVGLNSAYDRRGKCKRLLPKSRKSNGSLKRKQVFVRVRHL